MAKKEIKKSSSKAAAKVDTKANVVVKANPRLVQAFSGHDSALADAKSHLAKAAEIIQEEQLTKEEIIASMMEARDVSEKTAKEQYSRLKGIFNDEEVLQSFINGDVTLKQAREATKKDQKKPSKEIAQKNSEKKLKTFIGGIVNIAKEQGHSRTTIVNMLTLALKENGVK